jgi:hypothetical protein
MKESKFVECECHAEALKVEQIDNEVYISMYVHGDDETNHPKLLRRIIDAWNILWKNQYPEYAEVVITKDKAKSLGGWLLNCD